MVDRRSRDHATTLIRDFNEGRITNDQFDAAYPRGTNDLGVERIRAALWFTYGDLRTHKLQGRWALTSDGQQLFDRCVLFLATNREYEWPPESLISLLSLLLWWFPPMWWWRRRQRERFAAAGNIEVWPFLRRSDYEEAHRTKE